MSTRNFKTEYVTSHNGSRYGCATSLKGAVRAATIRIICGEYNEAIIRTEDQIVAHISKVQLRGRMAKVHRAVEVRVFNPEMLCNGH